MSILIVGSGGTGSAAESLAKAIEEKYGEKPQVVTTETLDVNSFKPEPIAITPRPELQQLDYMVATVPSELSKQKKIRKGNNAQRKGKRR